MSADSHERLGGAPPRLVLPLGHSGAMVDDICDVAGEGATLVECETGVLVPVGIEAEVDGVALWVRGGRARAALGAARQNELGRAAGFRAEQDAGEVRGYCCPSQGNPSDDFVAVGEYAVLESWRKDIHGHGAGRRMCMCMCICVGYGRIDVNNEEQSTQGLRCSTIITSLRVRRRTTRLGWLIAESQSRRVTIVVVPIVVPMQVSETRRFE